MKKMNSSVKYLYKYLLRWNGKYRINNGIAQFLDFNNGIWGNLTPNQCLIDIIGVKINGRRD